MQCRSYSTLAGEEFLHHALNLQAIVAPLEVGKADQDYSCLKNLYSRKDVFGLDLYEAGFGEQIEGMVKELFAGKGAVRATLHKYVSAR